MARRQSKRESKVQTPAEPASPSMLATAREGWQRFHAFKHEVVRLHVWVITAVSLLQPYAVSFFGAADTLPKEPWPFYLAVLKTTAPLTITLTAWVVMLVLFWPNDSEFGYIMLMSFIGGLMLTVAARVGNALGASPVQLVEYVNIGWQFSGLINALLSYLMAYKGAMFVSSLAISGYAGVVTYRAFVHELPVAETNDLQKPRRRAA